MNQTKTPKTDYNEFHPDGDGGCVGSWFARQLERELTTVTEQRDKLAEALRIIADGTSCRECGGEDQALLAREALQSITPNAEPC